MGKPEEFVLTYTKIAGTSHTNPDGTSRQKLIKKLKEGASLDLVREPDNPYDKNAIKMTYTKIAGTSHTNPDGTSRQKLIKKLKEGASLDLVREPDNPYDKNAIKICNKKGKQLGYIGRELAETLAPCLDNNSIVWAEVTEITSGEELYGRNIKVIAFQLRTNIEVLPEKEGIIKKRKKRERFSFRKIWSSPEKKSFYIGAFLWDDELIGYLTDKYVLKF